ncbi:hypothetical protein D3C71_1484970 [compost metagenome]
MYISISSVTATYGSALSGSLLAVGASLLAMAACQPTEILQVYPIHCGSELARDDALSANTFLCSFPQIPRKSPTCFSGCPSEARSLAFVGRCKISDRVWSPGFRMAHSAA